MSIVVDEVDENFSILSFSFYFFYFLFLFLRISLNMEIKTALRRKEKLNQI